MKVAQKVRDTSLYGLVNANTRLSRGIRQTPFLSGTLLRSEVQGETVDYVEFTNAERKRLKNPLGRPVWGFLVLDVYLDNPPYRPVLYRVSNAGGEDESEFVSFYYQSGASASNAKYKIWVY